MFGSRDRLQCRRLCAHIPATIACRAFHPARLDKGCRQTARNAQDARRTAASTGHPGPGNIAEHKPEHGHLRILHKRSIQITPVRRQNIHRLALAFLVLVPDLSGQINDRNNDPDSAEHLSDRADHLPVHSCWLMNDGTNPKQQKGSAVQSDHRTESVKAGFEPSVLIASFAPTRCEEPSDTMAAITESVLRK